MGDRHVGLLVAASAEISALHIQATFNFDGKTKVRTQRFPTVRINDFCQN